MTAFEARENAMQVVMLGLGTDLFAVEAGLVREIIDPVPVTRVAGAKPHLAAMINVRGNVVPLADIRLRLGMDPTPPTGDTRVVVIEITLGDDPVVVGVLADKVYEVTELPPGGTQPTPSVGLAWPPEFIRFIAKWNDTFVIVPELQTLLN